MPTAAPAAPRIRVTRGHLTTRERQVIAHMLTNGMTTAKTARIRFTLAPDPDTPESGYTVTTSRTERDDWGRPYTRTDRATFTLA